MFKTLESFRKQIDVTINKVIVAQEKLSLAESRVNEAKLIVRAKADSIRGEADALVVRANQINSMLDALVPDSLS